MREFIQPKQNPRAWANRPRPVQVENKPAPKWLG